MKRRLHVFIFLIFVLILTACSGAAYDDGVNRNVPDVDAVQMMQRAVEDYQAATGVLPIKESDMETDLFIKYRINFDKLIPHYLAKAPDNAYEKGGLFQYVIWDAENNPTIKLIDLRVPEKLREINMAHMTKQYPQFGERVAEHIYTINHENLGFEEPLTVPSPYSQTLLPFVMTAHGDVLVDYSIDLQQFIDDNQLTPKPGEDVRYLLAEAHLLLPAYSLPYTVDENNEVVFMYTGVEQYEKEREALWEQYHNGERRVEVEQ